MSILSTIQLKFMVRGAIAALFAGLTFHFNVPRYAQIGILVYYAYNLAGDVVEELKDN